MKSNHFEYFSMEALEHWKRKVKENANSLLSDWIIKKIHQQLIYPWPKKWNNVWQLWKSWQNAFHCYNIPRTGAVSNLDCFLIDGCGVKFKLISRVLPWHNGVCMMPYSYAPYYIVYLYNQKALFIIIAQLKLWKLGFEILRRYPLIGLCSIKKIWISLN